MTSSQLELFKAMTPDMVISKYGLMLRNKQIGFKQYADILRLHRSYQKPLDEPKEPENHNWSDDEVIELTNQFTTHTDQVSGKSQKERLLHALSDGGWHRSDELLRTVYGASHLGIARLGARVHDLKQDGYNIESEKDVGTIWKYKMST